MLRHWLRGPYKADANVDEPLGGTYRNARDYLPRNISAARDDGPAEATANRRRLGQGLSQGLCQGGNHRADIP
ncbi:hypothetical protein CHELA40_14247 [Chelatococcus asaccharovorans]|nr:hypothetical protein CHELA17_61372 [Chelatococcus asaccharovorans]CAH1676197.1 hypothetical protein CHELA40_14247 [Chelatococcus asaccharovorans]